MSDKSIYQDVTQPIQDRVDDLVSQMTLEEKVSQMLHDAPAIERLGDEHRRPVDEPRFDVVGAQRPAHKVVELAK